MVSYNSVYLGLLTSILVSSFVRNNPLWFGKSVLKTAEVKELVQSTFTVYTEHPLLDTILNSHVQNELENDLVPYRNHCLRVLSFARFFYQREMNQTTQEPVPHRYIDLMAISLAYHDLDLWMANGHLNYLRPSADLAKRELVQKQHEFGIEPPITDYEYAMIDEIIMQHHKYTSWKAAAATAMTPTDKKIMEAVVNAVRMGDWTDFTVGLIRYAIPAEYVEAAYTAVPESGFHMVLGNMGFKLSPNSLIGQLEVLKILKW